MISTAKIIAFVGTQDPDKAREFYAGKLGLSLIADEQIALVFDANQTMLRVS